MDKVVTTLKFAVDSANTYILRDANATLHIADSAVHVTSSDKTNWDGKANASDVYTKGYIDSKFAGIDTVLDNINGEVI